MKKKARKIVVCVMVVMSIFAVCSTAFAAGETLNHSGTAKNSYYTTNSVPQKTDTRLHLNSHTKRDLKEPKVSKEKAKESLNKDLNIESEELAVIPTEWKTEVLCWEFEGNIDGLDFIVYVNAETGKEEDILIITNTPNGILTH